MKQMLNIFRICDQLCLCYLCPGFEGLGLSVSAVSPVWQWWWWWWRGRETQAGSVSERRKKKVCLIFLFILPHLLWEGCMMTWLSFSISNLIYWTSMIHPFTFLYCDSQQMAKNQHIHYLYTIILLLYSYKVHFYLSVISSRRQLERFSSLRRQKQEFVPGFWNINTIQMGGLAREPELDGMLYFSLKNTVTFMKLCYLVSKTAWMNAEISVSEKNPEAEIQDAVSSFSFPHNLTPHFCFPLITQSIMSCRCYFYFTLLFEAHSLAHIVMFLYNRQTDRLIDWCSSVWRTGRWRSSCWTSGWRTDAGQAGEGLECPASARRTATRHGHQIQLSWVQRPSAGGTENDNELLLAFHHYHPGFMRSHGCVCALRQLLHGSRLLGWSRRGSSCSPGWKTLRGRRLTPTDFSSVVHQRHRIMNSDTWNMPI